MIEAVIGVAGGLVIAYISYRFGERSASKREEREAREEDLDLRLYAEIVTATQDGSVFSPDPETDRFKRAVRLQERGLIERLPLSGRNYFTLPGAQIRLDTSKKLERPAIH